MQIEQFDGEVIIRNAFSVASLRREDVAQGEFSEERTGPVRHVGIVVPRAKGDRWMRIMALAPEDAEGFRLSLSPPSET